MKKTLLSLLALVLVTLTGVFWFRSQESKQARWVAVKSGPVIQAVYGLGTVTSYKVFTLKVGVSTTVAKLYVHEGDEVTQGAPLVKLTDVPLVKAPFDGVVTALKLHQGESVFAQSELLTVRSLKDRYILVSLEQHAAVKVKPGQRVKVTFETLPGKVFTGKVNSIYPNKDEFYVRIDVATLPSAILPDMTADVAIEVGEQVHALIVPTSALSDSSLTIKRDGKVQTLKISTGALSGNNVTITSGNLKASDLVRIKE